MEHMTHLKWESLDVTDLENCLILLVGQSGASCFLPQEARVQQLWGIFFNFNFNYKGMPIVQGRSHLDFLCRLNEFTQDRERILGAVIERLESIGFTIQVTSPMLAIPVILSSTDFEFE